MLKDKQVTSVLVGASSSAQLKDNISSIDKTGFTTGELEQIEKILA